MIQLSASSIKDFLICPARFFYRINAPEYGTITKPMLIGNIIHEIIEKYWNDEKEGIKQAINYAKVANVDNTKVLLYLRNFYKKYQPLLTEDDKIESHFKIRYNNDVTIVGSFDRIRTGLIFDWKTSDECPDSLENDVQFILYYDCYKKIYGEYPLGLYYVSLPNSRMVTYTPNQRNVEVLFDEVIPNIVHIIKGRNFSRNGIYCGYCKNCMFNSVCRSS